MASDPIDTDAIRTAVWGGDARLIRRLCDKVDRLRAENTALAAVLADIAEVEKWDSDPPWRAVGECAGMNHVCHVEHPDDPGEWCPVCVAEICWCAWKMGVLG